jgi:hypothetical protein
VIQVANTVLTTAKGREVWTGRLLGATPTQAEPKNLGWGTGGVAGGPFTAAVTDVAPFQEAAEARIAATSSLVTTTTTNDTYQLTGAVFTSLSNQTIAEVFACDSATKPFSTTVTGGTAVGSNSGTTLTTAASYTPANNTYVQVRGEVMLVTAGTGTTSLTVTRGQNGSTASSAIASGDQVTLGNPPGTATANGSMFIHASFTGLPLNTNDTLTPVLSMKIT